MTKRAIFDIEANGFKDKVTKIHCLVIEDFDTGKQWTYRSDKGPTIAEGVEHLSKIPVIIGHNILDYDIPVIKKFYPKFTHGKLEDTLVMSRVIWADLKNTDFALHRKGKISPKNIGRHSLESWGERLGLLKGDYGKTANWEEIDDEMVEYCELDVRVNAKLYNLILRKNYPASVLEMEQEIHRICLEQTEFGFPFDVKKANKLLGTLMSRKSELYQELYNKLGKGWYVSLGEKVSKRTVNYKDVLRGNEKAGCEWTKVKYVEFNPNSRAHLTKRLQEVYNWVPKKDSYGADGLPNLDEEILSKMKYPIAPIISEYLMIQKRLGMLSEGKQAWLTLERDGKIHGRVNTMGAITARATHSDPNLAQIPSNAAPYGKECRELFIAPKGWKLFGTDASGLELRCLAHYMARWDGGAYGDIIMNGDIHTANQLAAGLPSRGTAKTFIYGFLYGGGDAKIGSIVNGSKARGKALREQFLNNTPALKQLRNAVDQTVQRQGRLKAIDGRYLPVRHAHAALNTLLQSAGSIICKQWIVNFHNMMKERGFNHDGSSYIQQAWVHDEMVVAFDPKIITYELLCEVASAAMNLVKEQLNFRMPLDISTHVGDSYSEVH